MGLSPEDGIHTAGHTVLNWAQVAYTTADRRTGGEAFHSGSRLQGRGREVSGSEPEPSARSEGEEKACDRKSGSRPPLKCDWVAVGAYSLPRGKAANNREHR